MAAATRTYPLYETLPGTSALPPPPTRHALFLFIIALAVILNFGTAGWSDIHNGSEGIFASGARQLAQGNNVEPPTLLHWLIVASFKMFGVRAASARFPIAAAMVISVGFTFLIGERIAGYWRGFAAGLIHCCCLSAFVWGRIITPEPIFAAFLGGAIYCAVCAYQRQRTRRWWLSGVLVFVALAWISRGTIGLLYPLLILGLLALSFREAGMRFSQVSWLSVILFVVFAAVWLFWLSRYLHAPPNHSLDQNDITALWPFLKWQFAWALPVSILILPGVCFALGKILRTYEFDLVDAIPLYWMAVVFLPLIFSPHRRAFDSIPMWGGGALWAACAWDRMPRRFRLIGLGLAGATGLALALISGHDLSHLIPISAGHDWRPILLLAGLPLLATALLAGYFAMNDREMLALAIVMLGSVPMGLSAAESMARLGSEFSLANAAQFLSPRLEDGGEVFFEGSASASSSLGFYLANNYSLLRDEDLALEKMAQAHPVFLIIHKDRIPHWQDRLTERFHIFHQETTCGPRVVVANDIQLKN